MPHLEHTYTKTLVCLKLGVKGGSGAQTRRWSEAVCVRPIEKKPLPGRGVQEKEGASGGGNHRNQSSKQPGQRKHLREKPPPPGRGWRIEI